MKAGRYPFETEMQKKMSAKLNVNNRSVHEEINENDVVIIKVAIENLYVESNYSKSIEHLPGVIELDVLDSFKMLCRRFERHKILTPF